MANYIDRMVEEHDNLNTKIGKLSEFLSSEIFYDLNMFQKDLMIRQLNSMQTYLSILKVRINYAQQSDK